MSKQKNLRLIDAPIYRYWQALYLAFYSRRLYVDVMKRWRGYGVLYFLLAISVFTIPLAVRTIIHFHQYFEEQMVMPLERMPMLYIQNGNVIFDKPMPYMVKNDSGDILAIIDTTGKVTEINESYPHLTILITQNKIYFRPPAFQLFLYKSKQEVGENVYAQSINKYTNEVFVGKKWIVSSGILKLEFMAELLLYPMLTGFIFGTYMAFMIFLAFVGQLFSIIIFKFRLKYKDACRIFLVSATPQTAVFFALHTVNLTVPGEPTLYTVLLAGYFSYAVLAIKRQSNKLVRV